jgi:endoglucanase
MKAKLRSPKLVIPLVLGAWMLSPVGFGSETSSTLSLRVDVDKVLGRVPALRGVHMAPMQQYNEDDLIRLKNIGCTCVRFGFSGLILEDESEPGQYKEAGFQYLDRFVEWGEKHNVGVILDMHHCVGRRKWEDTRIWIHYFGSKQPKEYQDRFVNLWREIAKRFVHRRGVVAYELLNEPNPPHADYEVWNQLAARATAAIREVDREHPIIVNSIGCANPDRFKGLTHTGDSRTIYSFHTYEPRDYHQQKRLWGFNVDGDTYYYPAVIKGKYWNRPQIRAVWETPIRFAEKHGVELFCGEFGCVSECPPMTDMVYLMDQISLFHELGIGWTLFGYIRREIKPSQKGRFDCNLFLDFVPEGRLYRFERKINLIRFFLEKEGSVLALDQPEDNDITLYGVKEDPSTISLLISNKDRRRDRRIALEIVGCDSAAEASVAVMDVASDDFQPRGRLDFRKGQAEATLPPLSITKVNLTVGAQKASLGQ